MPNDVDELFTRLAEDASRAHLRSPAEVRRRGDRRTAVRSALAAVAVVAVVAGVVVGGSSLVDRTSSPDVVDTPTPSPTPAPSSDPVPTAVPDGVPTSIPGSAFLSAADLNDSADPIRSDVMPTSCEVVMTTTDGDPGQLAIGRTVHGFYRAPDLTLDDVPDGTVHQEILVYDNGDRSLEEATHCRDRVVRPSQVDESTTLYEVDDSWLAVVRVRHVVSMLWLQGWEGTSADEEDARRLATAAAARLRVWLR